jgi:hypothetical protein
MHASSIRRSLSSFGAAGPRRRRLIAEAVVWLIAARLALIVVPFPWLARRLGAFVPPSDPRVAAQAAPTTDGDADVAREISWAVQRGAAHAPFRAVCLPQAMAARIMLRRRGVASVLRFGARASGGGTPAGHAWLDAAGVKVTGYPIGGAIAEIACFV